MICIKIDDRDQVLHQWDTGQRLVLRGVPGGAKVDFYHEGEEPLGRESYEEDGAVYADIPDVLLQAESKLYACIRVQDETVGETVYKWFAIVHPRPKPSDYIYTEEEKKTWEDLQAQIDELKENGAGNSTLVQSVNGIAPDENGNVEIDFDDPVETDPTVFDWAKRELFNKADLPTSIQSFVTVDGIEYYRYHAGATYGFTWYNPSPLPGAVTITARGVAQYGGTNGTRLKTIYSDGTYGPDLYIVASGESRTVTVTTDTSKTLAKITGNYDMENWVLLDMSVMSVQAEYNRGLPLADSNAAGGVLADSAEETDTQPVRIGPDGKLYTAPGGGVVVQAEEPEDTDVLWIDTDDDDEPEETDTGTDKSLGITGAEVGQTVRITEVDENGVPTAWEAVETGETWVKIVDYTASEQIFTADIPCLDFSEDLQGNPISVKELLVKFAGTITGGTGFRISLNGGDFYEVHHAPADSESFSLSFVSYSNGTAKMFTSNSSGNVVSTTRTGYSGARITSLRLSGPNYNSIHANEGGHFEVWGRAL